MCLLELLTGLRPDQHDLRDLAQQNLTALRISRVLDANLFEHQEVEEENLIKEALGLANLALQCLAYDKSQRSTVCDILPALEQVVNARPCADAPVERAVIAPEGMHYDPDTGELVYGNYQ
jgi:hypothetical protein